MFPFVDLSPGRFQLRLSTASTWETISNLPAVFRGEYRSVNLIDFLCESIEMRIEHAVPVQVGGDVQDRPRDRLSVALHEEAVRVLA